MKLTFDLLVPQYSLPSSYGLPIKMLNRMGVADCVHISILNDSIFSPLFNSLPILPLNGTNGSTHQVLGLNIYSFNFMWFYIWLWTTLHHQTLSKYPICSILLLSIVIFGSYSLILLLELNTIELYYSLYVCVYFRKHLFTFLWPKTVKVYLHIEYLKPFDFHNNQKRWLHINGIFLKVKLN